MKTPLKFKIGLKQSLESLPTDNGSIYITEDTSEIFYDDNDERKQWIPDVDCIQIDWDTIEIINYGVMEEEEEE